MDCRFFSFVKHAENKGTANGEVMTIKLVRKFLREF